jgi:ribosomal protein L40E
MPQYLDHARINADWPDRAAQCQRCGDVYNLTDLTPQYFWAGLQLQNSNIYVCHRCLDIPAPFQRTIILPPDPPPTFLARQIYFPAEEMDYFTLEDGTPLLDETLTISIVPES